MQMHLLGHPQLQEEGEALPAHEQEQEQEQELVELLP